MGLVVDNFCTIINLPVTKLLKFKTAARILKERKYYILVYKLKIMVFI